MERFQMIKNQYGSISFSFLIFSMIIFMLALNLIQKKMNEVNKSKSVAQAFLCTKKYTGLFKRHKKKILKLNKFIMILNTTKKASLFIPYLGLVTAKNLQNAERALISIQNALHVSFLKNIYTLYKSSCSFSPNISKTPFEHNVVSLKRDSLNRAKLRRKKWNVYYLSIHQSLKIIHTSKQSKVLDLI
jgi:hypothetical protein